ncbi:hypothetical protein Z043_121506 [Scleropages formosus]|uniref:Tektin n=1 Tax=Scleropages formosus TaxID=113540 RepID=A0A0P7UH95_SCLFO|nr:hypothetical protein Z043_121506 [Scleropages formosus]
MAASPMKERKRCSVADWESSNRQLWESAELRRLTAHRIRQEARHLRNDTLSKVKEEAEHVLAALLPPLEVSVECLSLREGRRGGELVCDPVEAELKKEVEASERAKRGLQQHVDKAFQQLFLLQEARQQLTYDLQNKMEALDVDMRCQSLTVTSPGISLKLSPLCVPLGLARLISSSKQPVQCHCVCQYLGSSENAFIAKRNMCCRSTSPQEWEQFSRYNISRAQEETQTSQQLREDVTLTLAKVQSELQAQHAATNFALRKRYHKVDQACSELHWQQKTTREEVAELELDICRLEEDLQAKEAPLKLVHTRLENRATRPGVDLCQDQVQHGLMSECKQLEATIMSLKKKVSQAQ